MGSFFLMGCGGSKFTVEEDELGLPCKRDMKRGETTRTKRENGTMMNGDSTYKSHENENGSNVTTIMSMQKQQVPTYEVKLVNNQLVQQVTMTPVTGKNSTITNEGRRDSDYDGNYEGNYEDGSRISNFNDDSYTRSPSFREYCNNDDSKFEGSEDRELGIENDEKVDNTSQNRNEIVILPVRGTRNDDMVRYENENGDTKKNGSTNGIALRLRKVFPIHILTNMRRKSSR